MPEGSEKVCVLCGLSCAGQPRVKNAEGRYAHRSCLEKQRSASAPPAAPVQDDDADLMAALLDGDPAPAPAAPAGMQAGCPGCGSVVPPDAVVCTGCGFNLKTGKAGRTKVSSGGGSGLGALAANAGSAAAGGAGVLVTSAIAASVAALLGAAVWAGIALGTGYEVGYVAIGVGVAAGFGAALGARGNAGVLTGLIAVIAAVIAISGGKYAAISQITDRELDRLSTHEGFFEGMSNAEIAEWAQGGLADDILSERLDAGGLDPATEAEYTELVETGYYPDDYPREIIDAAASRWINMDDAEQERYKAAHFDAVQENLGVFRDVIVEEGFLASFGIRDIFFFGFAIVAAFGLGSGGGLD